MNSLLASIESYRTALVDVVSETIWPTRCAVCDVPGEVLCDQCRRELPYIDWWRACPRCGSPFGAIQCCECNDVMLAAAGRSAPGYDGCASAVLYGDAAARIVRTWKDAGDRALSAAMARIMAPYALPTWLEKRPVIVGIPASRAARRARGFDHGAELALALAHELDLPVAYALDHPRSLDQRTLGRRGRIANMSERFSMSEAAQDIVRQAASVILVDDVHTTGSTLFAAADALHAAGVQNVWALTFARVL
ncbi:double zinc ribbon domain-containing protein [Adlercreutzia sp. ZJ141]|uniref:double zinc ribbon domain-containing protein n=1 Tax=Adlercreutzia sp. ZJ141 TaxID=2709406 RepID=UPI0013EBF531|nr:double zinc ribbon domain-containing protein [Adlercreutzia sp. ZJ141]